jgi:hypothetical protein
MAYVAARVIILGVCFYISMIVSVSVVTRSETDDLVNQAEKLSDSIEIRCVGSCHHRYFTDCILVEPSNPMARLCPQVTMGS